jgi:hypothetical protein
VSLGTSGAAALLFAGSGPDEDAGPPPPGGGNPDLPEPARDPEPHQEVIRDAETGEPIAPPPAAEVPAPAAGPTLSPEVREMLRELPERIAESLSKVTAGAESLEEIAGEVRGHRDNTQALVEGVRRVADASGSHAELAERTNGLLEEQNRLAGATLDGLTAMRAALRTVEETGERHVAVLGHLESSHRQVLEVYQSMLAKANRRLARLALAAVLTSAAAIAGLAIVVYLVFIRAG